RDLRVGTAPPAPHRSRPSGARLSPFPMALACTRRRLRPRNRGPPRSGTWARWVKNTPVTSCRPTGRLAPTPAARAEGASALAALEDRARGGASILLDAAAPSLGRLALPRVGGWRQAPRGRRPSRPLRQRQRKRAEALTRQAGRPYRSWSRLTRGV